LRREEKEERETVYNVEYIVAHRRRKHKLEFQVKWEGYPSEQNTWEPEENLLGEGTKKLLQVYKVKHGLLKVKVSNRLR